MSTVHFVLMGKGGVGKSTVSIFLAQHLRRNRESVFCADTDPTNHTFAGYPGIGAQHFDIMTPDMNFDKSQFDDLIEHLLLHPGDSVVDNGASSFLPMMAYMVENEVINTLLSAGKKVYIHSVLIGGLGLDETFNMLATILAALPAPLVVWENELFGPVIKGDVTFFDTATYNDNKSRIVGCVQLRARDKDTFGKDMHVMSSNRLTFDEVKESPLFRLMAKQRMATVRRDIETQLEAVNI